MHFILLTMFLSIKYLNTVHKYLCRTYLRDILVQVQMIESMVFKWTVGISRAKPVGTI